MVMDSSSGLLQEVNHNLSLRWSELSDSQTTESNKICKWLFHMDSLSLYMLCVVPKNASVFVSANITFSNVHVLFWNFVWSILMWWCSSFARLQFCSHLFSLAPDTINWKGERLVGEQEGGGEKNNKTNPHNVGKCRALLMKWISIQSHTTNKWPPPWSS